MNHLFQVTMYTGQQLVLEALQRWLQRPCEEPEQQRARRTGIKGLIILLLKTAATGVLATILDAAIEYRRRQLLAAAADGESSDAAAHNGARARFSALSLGPLSRAGISAWKTRLLVAIDELERQAEHFGIEPTHRFTPSKLEDDAALEDGRGKAIASESPGLCAAEDDKARQVALAKTIEQLQVLVRQGGDDAERNLEDRVDLLIDSLLGSETSSLGAVTPSAVGGLKSSASCSHFGGRTRTNSAGELSKAAGDASGAAVCYICMDRSVKVQVMGCGHDLCFQCARRLCAAGEHALPQCPFCRQPINGFSAVPSHVVPFSK
jgi:hypothetical protein